MTGPYNRPVGTWPRDTTWCNTWQIGPGAAQWVIDDLELGPRIANPWSTGRRGCVTDLATPHVLRRMNPTPPPHYPQRTGGQMSLLEAG